MSGLRFLLAAQFLSAFVDNMILFIAQAIILRDAFPSWYLQLVQATFLFAFIVLSPWVGRLADRYAKRWVLVFGNSVKCMGVLLLLVGIDPAISYAVVGVGAVVYSPAKYGILPCLTQSDQQLLHANAQVEGFTILAILSGAALGGWMADHSIVIALVFCIGLYLLSALLCVGVPNNPGNSDIKFHNAVKEFRIDLAKVLSVPNGRFSLLGTSGFWMASSVLRLAVFVWLPWTFGITSQATIGMMIMLSGVGLIVGAVVTPHIVPPGNVSRVIGAGIMMGLALMSLPWIPFLPLALAMQTICGSFGGIYVIPLNAMLQRVGEQTIGTGKIVAIQNFAENGFMFVGVLLFLVASWAGIPVSWSMTVNGAVLLMIVAGLNYLRNLQN